MTRPRALKIAPASSANGDLHIDRPLAPGARIYVLVVLTLVMSLGILDRQIMNILIEAIGKDLHLGDAQLGFLNGIAFALTYVLLCVPLARLADRWSRRGVVAASVIGWSAMTMLCGMARTSSQLFVARFGVGIGEAGGNPAAFAIVSDVFPLRERGTAMSVISTSSSIGLGFGLLFGGWSLSQYGWRTTFLLAGLPGIVLGAMMLLTFPRTSRILAVKIGPYAGEGLGATLRHFWSTRTLPNMTIAATLQTIISTGVITWVPAFLIRSYGLSPMAIGAGLGTALGLGSLVGHLAGGPAVDWLGRHDMRWHLWLPAITAPLTGLLTVIAFVGPLPAVFIALGGMVLLSGLFAGPMFAIGMNLTPSAMRATINSYMILVLNAVALGAGPQLIGIGSDLLRPAFGTESLRIALLLAASATVPASWFFYRASRSYQQDLANVDLQGGGSGSPMP